MVDEHDRDEQLREELNEELAKALKALAETVARQTLAEQQRAALNQQRRDEEERQSRPVSAFPFSLLEQVLARTLRWLERVVTRLVTAVIR